MTSKEENVPKQERITVESSALNGLRGFAAVHVMIFHSLFAWKINTLGNVRLHTSNGVINPKNPKSASKVRFLVQIKTW